MVWAVYDTELYRQLLGLVAPWQVNRVDISAKAPWIDGWVDHPRRTRFTWAECERELPNYDHAEEREWRHLDSCQFLTCLHASPRRVNCPEHGVVQTGLPWAEPMSRFTAEQLGGIEAVTIDTWVPLSNPVRANLDGADDKIVCERFHIMGHLNKAVDSVRKQENRALATQGGKTLSGSKYLWLYGAVNLPSKHEGRFAALRRTDLKTGRAWTIKESMRHFWKYVQRGWALRHWDRRYFWATHSLIE